MTLNEAIKYCEDMATLSYKGSGNAECEQNHRQLAEWLRELQTYRNQECKTCEDAVSREIVDKVMNSLVTKVGSKKGVDAVFEAWQYLLGLPSVNAIQHTSNTTKDVGQRTNTLGDAVSRQAVLDTTHKTIYEFFDIADDNSEEPINDKDKLLLTVNKAICNKLKQLPSVNPQPKTGYWIDTGSGQMCSRCGEIQYGYDSFRRFCPNCGAKMIEPQESEVNNG